jgi:hypothetical protein
MLRHHLRCYGTTPDGCLFRGSPGSPRCPPRRGRPSPSPAPAATVVAGNLYRLLARQLSRYEKATPDRIWRHFLDATGTLHITGDAVTCALNLRSHHPLLIDAGFADLEVPIPWWDGRTLRFRFPPR